MLVRLIFCLSMYCFRYSFAEVLVSVYMKQCVGLFNHRTALIRNVLIFEKLYETKRGTIKNFATVNHYNELCH